MRSKYKQLPNRIPQKQISISQNTFAIFFTVEKFHHQSPQTLPVSRHLSLYQTIYLWYQYFMAFFIDQITYLIFHLRLESRFMDFLLPYFYY